MEYQKENEMSKIAFVFPGQGAQYIGMAQDFYNTMPECKETFDKATELLGFDMAELCFEENERLDKTEYTQAAILTATIAILKAVGKTGIKADITAGLSLGEYCALVANSALSFEDAVQLVRKRGIFMEHEVPDGKGTMAAILGLQSDVIESICNEIQKEQGNPVQPANYNCPGQIVISGEKNAVLAAGEKLKEAGARRVVELKVSGPFHSDMLKGAGEKLAGELKNVTFSDMSIPYVTNVTASILDKETTAEQIKELLKVQVSSAVKWQQSIENMINSGVDTFIEIGPGRTLSGFIRKIDRTKKVLNIEKIEDLEKLKEL